MLFSHVLLLFVLFNTSAAKNPPPGQDIQLGFIYWLPLTYFGAEGPLTNTICLPVIPVGEVPLTYTNDVNGIYFVADLWDFLPLEDEYKEDATGYFHESDEARFMNDVVNLRDQSINKGWARIAKGDVFGNRRQSGTGRNVKIRFKKKIEIYENMLQNFKERIDSGSLKLNLNVDGLGQIFIPYIEFGAVYWIKPSFLGSPHGPGSNIDHPVVPVGRVNDRNNLGHDLVFLAEFSGHLPLEDKYKGKTEVYFKGASLATPHSGVRNLDGWINIGWAQVALSATFCLRRHRGNGKDVHMDEDKMEFIRKNMQDNYDTRVKDGRLKLNFNKDDLNQYDPAGFTLAPAATGNFFVVPGHIYYTKSKSQFQEVKHLIVPVGEVPDSGEKKSYFVAELLDTRPSQLNDHWKSAEGYFTVEKIVTVGGVIIPKDWWINTSWAVEVPTDLLRRCKGSGRSAKMSQAGIDGIFESMEANYRERLGKGQSDFSITNRPVVEKGGPAGQLGGQNERPGDGSKPPRKPPIGPSWGGAKSGLLAAGLLPKEGGPVGRLGDQNESPGDGSKPPRKPPIGPSWGGAKSGLLAAGLLPKEGGPAGRLGDQNESPGDGLKPPSKPPQHTIGQSLRGAQRNLLAAGLLPTKPKDDSK